MEKNSNYSLDLLKMIVTKLIEKSFRKLILKNFKFDKI